MHAARWLCRGSLKTLASTLAAVGLGVSGTTAAQGISDDVIRIGFARGAQRPDAKCFTSSRTRGD